MMKNECWFNQLLFSQKYLKQPLMEQKERQSVFREDARTISAKARACFFRISQMQKRGDFSVSNY